MKIVGIIVNIFFPGLGTLIVGKIFQGIIQLFLALLAGLLIFTGIGAIIGMPLGFAVWIWAILCVAVMPTGPVEVVVVRRP